MSTKPKPVPAAQYRAMVDRAETAEQRAARLEAALDDARRGAGHDLDRLLAENARLRRLDAIRQTAHDLGFIDPQDAIARLADVDLSPDDAADAVRALADVSPHFLRAPRAPSAPLRRVSTSSPTPPTQEEHP